MTAGKILHMHFGKDGGAERFFVNLVQAFGERGFEQRFVIRPDRVWKPEIEALGPIIENHFRWLSLTRPLVMFKVHRMIKTWEPTVIMAWMSRSSQLIPKQSDALKLTRLGDYPRHLRHFRDNDLIVANAPGIAENCLQQGWSKPVHVISNFPREVTPVAIDRADLNTPKDAFVISGVGRFIRRKGFDTLVRAAARIPNAYLWLIGDGERRSELEALTAELGIAERTRFTGWVDEPMHWVAASDVFVIPSRHEPLGNVILESWHAGIPTVSTRSEGPSWFVEDGKDALMCDIDDVGGMTDAIERIKSDRQIAGALVEAGRAKLAAEFTKERIVDRYVDLFNTTHSGAPPSRIE